MLYEAAEQRLDEMDGWTADKFELMAELQLMRMGEAMTVAERVRGGSLGEVWDEVLRQAGEDGEHSVLAFLVEDRSKYRFPVVEEAHRLAQVYGEAASILRAYGVSGEDALPGPDMEMFRYWVKVEEGSSLFRRYDLNEAFFVPIPEGASDLMLTLLYGNFTPEELRASANARGGEADLIAIQEARDVEAMTTTLSARFGPGTNEEVRRYLKTGLTADLMADFPLRTESSDRRLIAVSKNVLGPSEHDKLMAEIEANFPGWCRECGTLPNLVGCNACRRSRRVRS